MRRPHGFFDSLFFTSFTLTIQINHHIWPINIFGNLGKTPEQFGGSISLKCKNIGNPKT